MEVTTPGSAVGLATDSAMLQLSIVTSGCDMSCIKINKPLIVYIFSNAL